jgi:hypothetical protein
VATCEEVGGMAWVAIWRAFLKQGNRVFYDFSKVIWHLAVLLTDFFSSFNSGFFDITVIRLLGDGYSLLGSKK